ncbi:hypothetical protein EDC04DRAFT_2881627 [Pisolithus marmoratus]|nr:hypothetical protein EDC04DRAFT_2881627 [Pisolithus marmoratus]
MVIASGPSDNVFYDPLTINLGKQTRALVAFLSARSAELLGVLSRCLAEPSLTNIVADLFRPLLLDLCARWLERASNEEEEKRFVAMCLLIENHEELFPVLSAFLRRPHLDCGPLAFVEGDLLSISALDTKRLQRLLLAYYRLLHANRLLPSELLWPASALSALFISKTPHPDSAVRYLAIRCYALHTGMAEVERSKLEREVFGEEVENGEGEFEMAYDSSGSGQEVVVDARVMPVLEMKRIHEVRNAMMTPSNFYASDEEIMSRRISESDLSPWVVNVHGILMLKNSPIPVPPSQVVFTPAAISALRNLAMHVSLRLPTLISSPPSSGKSLFLAHLASMLCPNAKDQIVTVHLADTSLDPRSLLGSYVSSPTRLGTFEWKDGVVVRAMKEGKWLVFEDMDKGSMEGSGLGDRARIEVPNRGRVYAAEGFAVFATRTVLLVGGNGHGTKKIPDPTFYGASKFSDVVVDVPSVKDVRIIAREKFPRIGPVVQRAIIKMWMEIKGLGTAVSTMPIGLRELEKFFMRMRGLVPSLDTAMEVDGEAEEDESGDAEGITLSSAFPNLAVREEMYLEARDVFFGGGALTGPARAHQERMESVVAEHLGLDEDRRKWVLQGRAPVFEVEKDVNGDVTGVRVGRSRLPARARETTMPIFSPTRPFAMHKPAVCLLSRIATAISFREPILLTGETGTGKTSAITHLATLLRRPLVSLNLSHQTESSDLLGGFKPIDARVPAGELSARFVELFGATFSRKRNVKFEESVRKAVQEGKWKRVAVLWKEAIRLAKERIEGKVTEGVAEEAGVGVTEGPRKRRKMDDRVLQASQVAWERFERDVDEFDIQHAQGQGKFAFDFVEGPLVRALRAGDWVLLDEINLASSETLECVTALLNGPTADRWKPVPRHPDFRLFACMNPATDVGKKDLPPNIRARFTEIDVPPPDADRETLLHIVHQYIGHSAIMNVAEFYAATGSDRRPHFSMRTLDTCIDGCLMAFTMVLDGRSMNVVVGLAQKHILAGMRNPKSVLSMEPVPPTDYIMTPSVEKKLIDLARIVLTRRFPVLIEGPTSSGKTSAGITSVRINNHEHTDIQEYIGSYVSDPVTGKLVFKDGLLVHALPPTEVLEALNRLLDDNRELVISETHEVVRPHPHFMLFATQNPPGLYAGRKVLSRAFRNRFLEVHFQDVPQAELEVILCQRCRIAPSYGQRIVSVFRELQKRRQVGRVFESKQGFATLRDLFRNWPRTGICCWLNERDAEEDRLVVKEVIESVMKVRIDESALYDLRPSKEFEAYIGCLVPSGSQVIWTYAMRRLFVLVARALRFNEPVLLVGETGSGKTSICQLYAEVTSRHLHTLSCHQNTETADVIGGRFSLDSPTFQDAVAVLGRAGFVDVPSDDVEDLLRTSLLELRGALVKSQALFQWHDGPLVRAMREGGVFLLDEISLADDSVLERLNSVLEPERAIVLAERGGTDGEYPAIHAADTFKLLATMNPGGDYGKKELSPALRNRFTEIWVPPVDNPQDLAIIVDSSWRHEKLKPFTAPLLAFCRWLRAWVAFSNAVVTTQPEDAIHVNEIFHHAAHMTFLDGLGSLSQAGTYSPEALQNLRNESASKLDELVPRVENSPFAYDSSLFAIPKGPEVVSIDGFNLNAPTTRENVMRVARACQLEKPILLEGSPGVGKTSLVTALAKLAGYRLCRINLSDQTDLIDLFGSDLPVEDGAPGEFAWKDAEFLRAMQEGHWVLLDEMNLAPQTVLEGLNAILDHRGTVFVPELGRTFVRHPSFRVFAAQNPLHQGGGRKGLPKSFLDRFTKVYVEELTADDLLIICREQFRGFDDQLLQDMITFNTYLNRAVVQQRLFGRDGSPWEFNLRDIMRWGELLRASGISDHPRHFLRTVYLSRFRDLEDRRKAQAMFNQVFSISASDLLDIYAPPPIISSSHVQIGHFSAPRGNIVLPTRPTDVLQVHSTALETIWACLARSWLVIVTGQRDIGKTSLIRTLANLSGNHLEEVGVTSATDTSDILGGFEQVDQFARMASIMTQILELTEDIHRYPGQMTLRSEMSSPLKTWTTALQAASQLLTELSIVDSNEPDFKRRWRHLHLAVLELSKMEASPGRFEWAIGWFWTGANTCNPSVLDRLNSLCEPNGVLVLSERGLSRGEVEILKPHPKFRLFMTVDPQYGELSRAMRNRGLEVSLVTPFTAEDRSRLSAYYRLPDSVGRRRGILLSEGDKPSTAIASLNMPNDTMSSMLATLAPVITGDDKFPLSPIVSFVMRAFPRSALPLLCHLRTVPSGSTISSIFENRFLLDTTATLTRVLKEPVTGIAQQLVDVLVSLRMLRGRTPASNHHVLNRLIKRSHWMISCSRLPIVVTESIQAILAEVQAASKILLESYIGDTGNFRIVSGLGWSHDALLTALKEDVRTSVKLLGLARRLCHVLTGDVFDYSTAYVLAKSISTALENYSHIYDHVASASTAFNTAISSSSGLGLMAVWSHLRNDRMMELGPLAVRHFESDLQIILLTWLHFLNVPAASLREHFQAFALATLPSSLIRGFEDMNVSDQIRNLSKRRSKSRADHQRSCAICEMRGHDAKISSAPFARLIQVALENHDDLRRFVPYQHVIWTLENAVDNALEGPSIIFRPTLLFLTIQKWFASLSVSIAHLGRCWVAQSRVILDLIVPDVPLDPAAILRRSAEFLQEEAQALADQSTLHSHLQRRTVGNETNFVISYLADRAKDCTTLLQSRTGIPDRSNVSRLNFFWTEVSQFMKQVIQHPRIDDLLASLESNSAAAFSREDVVQESISKFAQRLTSLYPEYNDILQILRLALSQLRLGLRLVRHAYSSAGTHTGNDFYVTSLVAFPPIRSISTLLHVPISTGSGVTTAERLLIIVAAAADYRRPGDLGPSAGVIFTSYEQAFRLWTIDRTRDEKREQDLGSLYRGGTSSYDVDEEAEMEREFLELFPTFEDGLVDASSSTSGEKVVSHHLSAQHRRQLLELHLQLMDIDDTRRYDFAKTRYSALRSYLETNIMSSSDSLDRETLHLQVSLLQEHFALIRDSCSTRTRSSNFYARKALKVARSLRSRIVTMVLQHLLARCDVVLALDLNSPNLLLQTEDWEILTDLIVEWRRLELSSWKSLLDSQMSEYWFHLYELLIRGPLNAAEEDSCNLSKYLQQVPYLLDDFIRSSSLGQFHTRLNLLKSFEIFIGHMLEDSATRSAAFGSVMRILLQSLGDQRRSLEKEVDALIKLATLKQSARKTHHQLYKIIRKFQRLSSLFAESMEGARQSELPMSSRTHGPPSSRPYFLDTMVPAPPSSAHLENLGKTLEKFHSYIDGRIRQFLVQQTAYDVEQAKDLASQTIPEGLSKEKREKFRKAWSDLLKELKRGGLAYHIKPDTASQLGDESWIRGQPLMPSSKIIATERGEVYFDRLRGCLPVLRKALLNHHTDVNTRDLSRGISLTESGYSLSLETRSTLAHALPNHTAFQHQTSRLQAIADAPTLSRIGSYDKVESLRLALSISTRAVEELADAIRVFDQTQEATDVATLLHECQALSLLLRTSRDRVAGVLEHSRSVMREMLLGEEYTAVVEASHLLETLPTRLNEMTNSFPYLAHVLVPTAQWICDQGTFSFPEISSPHIDPASDVDTVINTALVAVQNMLKKLSELSDPAPAVSGSDEPVDNYIRNGARTTSVFTSLLDLSGITEQVSHVSTGLLLLPYESLQAALKRMLPFLHYFLGFSGELLESQARWTTELFKLDYVVCSVVHALATRGFCIPPETEEGDETAGNEEGKELEGTGIGEGAGVENVSKEIANESERRMIWRRGERNGEKDDENTIEMSKTFEGELEDVEEEDDGEGEEESPEDGEGPDEQLGKLDRADPNKVDEKLWGDEPGGDEDRQEDELQQDRSGKTNDKSDIVAQERENKKGDRKKEDVAKEETTQTGDECEEDEDKEGVQEEERETPNAAGAPMDEHIPDANTLDLPEDMNLDNDKEGSGEFDMDEDVAEVEEEDKQSDEDMGRPDTNARHDTPSTADDEMHSNGGPPHATEELEDEMDVDGGDENQEQNADAGTTDRTAHPQDGTTDTQKDTASLQAQEGITGEESATETAQRSFDVHTLQPEPQASSDPAPTQVTPEAGSDSNGSQPGPAFAQRAPTSPPGSDPLRKLGDALKEIQKRFDEIFSAPEQAYPQEPAPKSDDAEQVMYEHDENEDGMQTLGHSAEEPVAKLKELTLVEKSAKEPEVADVDALMPEIVEARDVAMEHLHAEKTANRMDTDLEGAIAHTERDKAIRGVSTQALGDPVSTRTTEDEPESEPPSVSDEVVRAALESLTSSPDNTDVSAYTQLWTLYTSLTMPLSIALCESLRLILAPTLATRLRGDFRTGKRLNMRRVIAWVASEYTKDRIWLRRVKPSARAYQVLLAVDDSASMRGGGGGAVHLAYQTVVLVAQALGRLEAGEVGVARFGAGWELVRGFGEGARDWGSSPALGGRVLSALTFRQQRTDVAGFLEGSLGVLEAAREAAGSRGSTKDLWQLEIIISDGICQEHERLRRALRRARSMRVLVVFIVLDALNESGGTSASGASNTAATAGSATSPSSGSQSSILALNQVLYRQSPTTGQMELTMERYLDSFPFEYYVVLRDVEALPRVLADTLREFFEKVNEE